MANQAIIFQFQDAMMQVKAPEKTQSGFYLQQHGLLVTSALGLETVSAVKLYDKAFNEYSARVLYWDELHDLTFLEAPANWQGPAIVFGDPSVLKAGDKVASVGFEADAIEASLTGVILDPVSEQDGLNYIHVNAAIHNGNTGGPLVNNKGEVIGVNSEKIDGGYDYGYVLPLKYLQEALDLYKPYYGKVTVRCPHCGALVLQKDPDPEHCTACGEEITFPHPEVVPVDTIHTFIEKSIRQAGKSVSKSKVGFEYWAIQEGRAKINIVYSFKSYLVVIECILAKAPADPEKINSINRFLLEENGQLSHISLSKTNNSIVLGTMFDEKDFDVYTGTKTLISMIENADRYIGLLTEKYGCTADTAAQ
ncbi:trypsin-like peptidase domain-containing protein [Pseudoflavitalea rhizosphaerae]|uniref:trypsin-like peptidase domain-containing protein n=1 Tax=Pseudoflavitalea rhizosphaerae TaxID=1884793 RepID=UPI000F8D972E|nr:trypsin-like peptidase domain-containing protein [Pseudoflavitalea rhizosphaerae]